MKVDIILGFWETQQLMHGKQHPSDALCINTYTPFFGSSPANCCIYI